MLFSFLKSSKTIPINCTIESSSSTFDDFILEEEAALLTDFTLYLHDKQCKIDLLLFLPHYGLYLGEKIAWNLRELKGTRVKRLTRQSHKIPHTHIESTENFIYQKFQDVLSFDSTPIQRIFWMKNLMKSEFDTLNLTFHELLPKGRLIFQDDTALDIQTKLHALQEYQDNPFLKLKVIGSLRAHELRLPTTSDPFGSFISHQQQLFFDAVLTPRTILSLYGPYSSGKSTVFIRKIIDYLLINPQASSLVITPTKLGGELLRNELVALMEFSAVKCNLSNVHFYTHDDKNRPIETNPLFHTSTLIACDDVHLMNANTLERIIASKGSRSLLLCGVNPPPFINAQTYTLDTAYRTPIVNTIHFTHTKGALFTLLTGLKTHLETTTSNLIMILLPTHKMIVEYQKAIEEHLNVKCRILNDHFSLQYNNLEEITLCTPEYSCGLNVPHSYLINLNSDDPLYYPLALSRASDTITIISETNLEE
ncbi:MAG: hypothetical protein PHV62_07370 [Sulfuricurvum sp.]|nr:hypothetical protein [Sulfuricurvum sp.]